jgi:hypothetical protein
MTYLATPGARGFWAGVALSAPFVAIPLPSYLAPAVGIPLLIHCVLHGYPLQNLRRVPPIIYAVLALCSLHLASLVVSTTPYWLSVVKELVKAAAIVAVFVAARHQAKDLLRGFFAAVIPLGIVAAAMGLLTYLLFLNGFVFEPLIHACDGLYERRTALCADYTSFSMLMLITAVGLVIRISEHDALWNTRTIAWLICLAVVTTSGLLAGSGRFPILAPFVFVYWLWRSYWSQSWRHFKFETVPAVAVVALLSLLSLSAPAAPTQGHTVLSFDQSVPSFKRTVRNQDKELIIVPSATGSSSEAQVISPTFSMRSRSVRSLMERKFSPERAFGFGTRVDRWKLAADMIVESPLGNGFAYHQIFSCRFVECRIQDYPHMPILSAALMSGWIGGLLALAIYLLVGWSIWRAGWRGWMTGATVIVLLLLPYALISGDTVLSSAHWLIAALMLEGQVDDGLSRA